MAKKNEIYKELEQYGINICRTAAKIVAKELVETAKTAIELFYADYSPIKYKRQYYNFRNNSFKKYYKKIGNNIFTGGIELTPESMDNIYNYPAPAVHRMVFNKGMHGPNYNYFVPNMSPTPLEILIQKRDYIYDHGEDYIKKAIEQVG